ncbi:ABC transporter substrate-binding protein [Alicyclobacillus fastidiosus]|uniref:ABC transporter substrate-binding protein n=1 Tax=Alicyclobacillus fastidiosus TaxID=392011 RepID=A0ABY6ZB47_9BACL|nr:ABC transporter substrate-binding protein [Alicyclobacillus fastidiosus]WAH39757.1 ABC transporter substrate-binding protein [Alicyclobacillus fastidiosus]GMA60994.1 ABC transporter substrate-binding protein [Alicyclobacillus fastidiosus]
MKKKVFSVSLGILTLCSLVTGCGTNSGNNHVTTINFWYGQGGIGGTTYEQLIKEFNETHKNIHVIGTFVASSGSIVPQKLITAIAGSKAPDCTELDSFLVPQFAQKGALIDLTPYIQAQGLKKSDFIPAIWQANTFDGHLYAYPHDTDVRFLYWNKDLFKKAGLNPNQPPKTIAQLDQDAAKLTVHNSAGQITQAGFIPWGDQGSFDTWAWAFGATFNQNSEGEINLADSASIKSLQWQQKYAKEYGIAKLNAFTATLQNTGLSAFDAGKEAMTVDGVWNIATLQQQAPKLQYGVEAVPTVDGQGSTWSGGISEVIPKGAKHPEAAAEFLNWLVAPKQMLIWDKATTHLPTRMSMLKNLGTPGHVVVSPAGDKLSAELLPTTYTRPNSPLNAEIWDGTTSLVSTVTNDTSQNPATALKAFSNKINQEIKNGWY